MGDTFSISVLLRLIISLAILLGGLYGLKAWNRRPGGPAKRGSIDVVARASLGRSSAVHIVDVGDRRFLLGTGEHQVNLLTELERPPDDVIDATAEARAPGGAGDDAPLPLDDPNGSGVVTRTRPRIGLMDWLRRITIRTPQRVRVIRGDATN